MKKLVCIVLMAALMAASVACAPAVSAPEVDAAAIPAETATAVPTQEPAATAQPETAAPADAGAAGVGVTRGTTSGNAVQSGLAVQSGAEMYYAGSGALYRQDTASGISASINDGACKYINVVGDTLWCVDYGTSTEQVPEIVSMKTDGSGKTGLISGYADCLSVVDGYMYYLMLEMTDTGYCSTPYRAKLDGSEAAALTATGTDYRFLNIVGDNAYFTDYVPAGGENHIFRVSINGGEAEQIAAVPGSVVRLIAVGDKLLYAAYEMKDDKSVRTLTALSTDGTELWQTESLVGFNADTEYIYYIEGVENGENVTLTLKRMDWERGGVTELARMAGGAELWLVDDAVVYSDGTTMYTLPKTGGTPSELLKEEAEG